MGRLNRSIALIVGLVALAIAAPPAASAVVVTIVNDLRQDQEGSVIEVDSMKGLGVRPGHKLSIMPGEKKRISPRNVSGFTVSRVYGDFKEKYVVQCSTDRRVDDAITLRLVDVVQNQMPLGCQLWKTGKWYSSAGTIWEKEYKITNLPLADSRR